MERTFRLFDFNIYNEKISDSSNSEEDESLQKNGDNQKFQIQMFGINENGETCSIFAEDFKPFFYVKVADSWSIETKTKFLDFIKKKLGKYYENSITECKLIKKRNCTVLMLTKNTNSYFSNFKTCKCFTKQKKYGMTVQID